MTTGPEPTHEPGAGAPGGAGGDPGAAQRTILLAEYAALRAEITSLLSMQGQFMSFSIVFFGFVLTMWSRDAGMATQYLPLLPVPFGVLGLSYADVTARILRAARYIEHELRPPLQRLGGGPCLGWERYIRERHPHRRLLTAMDNLRWAFFLTPAAAFTALAFAVDPALAPRPWWMWAAWALGAILVAANVGAWSRVVRMAAGVTPT